MTLDDASLARLRRDHTRASAMREGCLDANTLGRAAHGELTADERGPVVDHLASCADCAEELQLIAPLVGWAERSAAPFGRHVDEPATPAWLYAAAAVLALACAGLLFWNTGLRRERAELMARLEAPPPVEVPATPPSAPAVAHANVAIVDLQPDALRGSASERAAASVPAEAELVTLILNSDAQGSGEYAIDILDATGRSVWRANAVTKSRFNTFTIALSPRLLGAGTYRLLIIHAGMSGPETVGSYPLRIEPGAATR
jgi:hypothetical protein